MSRYEGLSDKLRKQVLDRDGWRCRWCGSTNQGGDLHHIRYRRGYADDVAENLITLCRTHHGFVHGTKVGNRTIMKDEAQQILRELVATPGITGAALRRQKERASRNTGAP